MAWRGLHITKPARLSLADGQIVVSQGTGDVRLPLEDIGWIILDDPRLSLTTALLAACAENCVALINTDGRDACDDLTVDDRRKLAGIPLETGQIGEAAFNLLAATEHCVASLMKAVEAQDPSALTLPSISLREKVE